MNMEKSKKLLAYLAAAYWVLVIMVYLIAHPQFRYSYVTSDAPTASISVGEIVDGMEIRQSVVIPAHNLSSISLMTGTYNRANSGSMILKFVDEQGNTLAEQSVDVSTLEDGKYSTIVLREPLSGCKETRLNLLITTQGCTPGNAVTVYAGNMVTAGRFDIVQDIAVQDRYSVNDQTGIGKLCVKLSGTNELSFYQTYWYIVTGVFAAVAALCVRWWQQMKKSQNNPLSAFCRLCTGYTFLIKQLVGRAFKTKYKRSVLGMAWSFLNPLLTMAVQYVVFSTLFKNNIPNYAVYLLTGIVFMNFFSESVSMCMTSITGNAPLIKKVYMPKYIYPVSSIISSLVNFLIALIPLLLVMIVTGLWPSPALLLLVFNILCLLGFIVGVGLLLTTSMTFFHDTQFLWGVVSMMWMYLTPVFYPESIIPANLLTLYRMNPMYQYITFARTCIIDSVSPEPAAYLWCILSSVVALILGVAVFKKNQDKFVLYL